MTIHNTYTRWVSEEGEVYYFCVAERLEIGIPIDRDGREMELDVEDIYWRNPLGEFCKLIDPQLN
jgi:hypothetical protein